MAKRKRSRLVAIRLTIAEIDDLRRVALLKAQTVSNFVRAAIRHEIQRRGAA